jgi:hypothetical protein
VDCPECGLPNTRVVDTFKGTTDRRKRECPCGVRFSSTETIDKGSIRTPPVPISRNRLGPMEIGCDPPLPISTNDRPSLSPPDLVPVLVDPDPILDPDRDLDRARKNAEARRKQAEFHLKPLVDALDGEDFADARDMHDAVEQMLFRIGFECEREVPVKLSDTRGGAVDLVARKGGLRIALELDMQAPRVKSLRKLRAIDVDLRVVLLRTAAKGRQQGRSGIDFIYGLGSTPRGFYPPAFEQLWAAYPRKDGKGAALRAWEKLKPDLGGVMAALSWQRHLRQWTTDGGAFVPHLATYLNQRRWEDEPSEQPRGKTAVAEQTHGALSRYLDRQKEKAESAG